VSGRGGRLAATLARTHHKTLAKLAKPRPIIRTGGLRRADRLSLGVPAMTGFAQPESVGG